MSELDSYIWSNIVSLCDFPTVQQVRQVNQQLNKICKDINYKTIVCHTRSDWHPTKKLVIKYYETYMHWKFYELDKELTFKDTIHDFLEQFQLLYELIGHVDELVVEGATKQEALEMIYKSPMPVKVFANYCFRGLSYANDTFPQPCQTYEDVFSVVCRRFSKQLEDEIFTYYEYPHPYWLTTKFVEWRDDIAVINFEWIYG